MNDESYNEGTCHDLLCGGYPIFSCQDISRARGDLLKHDCFNEVEGYAILDFFRSYSFYSGKRQTGFCQR